MFNTMFGGEWDGFIIQSNKKESREIPDTMGVRGSRWHKEDSNTEEGGDAGGQDGGRGASTMVARGVTLLPGRRGSEHERKVTSVKAEKGKRTQKKGKLGWQAFSEERI